LARRDTRLELHPWHKARGENARRCDGGCFSEDLKVAKHRKEAGIQKRGVLANEGTAWGATLGPEVWSGKAG